MKRLVIMYVLPIILLSGMQSFTCNQANTPAPKKTLRAGTAKIMITPQTPIPLSGFGGRKGPFKGVHDDLYARVIVFSDGENKTAIISAELIGFSNSFWKDITQKIEKEIGIKKEFVLLLCVHTHSGPATNVYYDEENTPEVLTYMEELKGKLVSAIKDAMKTMVPVSIGAGKGECKMNISRRAQDGKGNITLGENPYAPCDHEVSVIRVDDTSGNHLALLMNWPCHACVLGPKNYMITSDWPGAASKYAEEGIGNNAIAPIIVGASGDINPIYGPQIDFESNSARAFGKDAIGEDLANVSMSVMKDIKTYPLGSISATQRVISLPSKETWQKEFVDTEDEQKDSLKVRLSAVKIGNIILTGVSGEVSNEISVKMRNQSTYSNTLMITHCNGSCDYLVTEDSYAVPGESGYKDKYHPTGGYEQRKTRAKTGAEMAIIINLLEMINEL